MSVMGLSQQMQDTLAIVAGVLHLGNVDFVERNNYAEIANKQCQLTTVAFFPLCSSLTDSVIIRSSQ